MKIRKHFPKELPDFGDYEVPISIKKNKKNLLSGNRLLHIYNAHMRNQISVIKVIMKEYDIPYDDAITLLPIGFLEEIKKWYKDE